MRTASIRVAHVALALSLAEGASVAARHLSLGSQQFHARADIVTVDVSVRSGNRAVNGLTPADFSLTDNGVPQQLQVFSIETVPIEVTLLLEGHHFEAAGQLNASIQRIRALLAPDDRIRLLTFSNTLTEVVGWQPPDKTIELGIPARHGHLWPQDPLAMVLIRGGTGERRHLVVLFTGGGMGVSTIRPGSLVQIASRFDGVLHVVLYGSRGDDDFLRAAEATGGQLHRDGSPNRLADTFERVFESFRRSYVLRYTPVAVKPGGWHAVDVRVTRPGGERFTVRARKGYWWGD